MNGRPYRQYSESDGLKVWLCVECHHKVHQDATLRLKLKEKAELAWLKVYGKAQFRARYGKNYL